MYKKIKIKDWYNSKYRNKILFPTILISMVSVLVLGVSIFYLTSQVLVKAEVQLNDRAMNQSSELLGRQFNSVKNISNLVIQDREINKVMEQLNQGYEKDYYEFLENRLFNYSIDSSVYNIRIYLNGTDELDYEKGHKILNETYIHSEPWYLKHNFDKNRMYWYPTYQYSYGLPNDGRNVISLIRPIYKSEERIGLIVIDMLEQSIYDVIHKAAASQDYKINLVNDEGYVVSTDDKSKVGIIIDDPDKTISYIEGYRSKGQSETVMQDSYVFVKDVDGVDWYLISEVPKKYIFKQTFELAINFVFIALLVFILIVIFTVVLSNKLTSKIARLSADMKDVIKGDLDVQVVIDSEDEIGDLQQSFDALLITVREMIEKQYQDQETLRKAEFSTLQAQINPHFLYNILDMINWMAIKNDADEISYVVSKLAKFFRISLSSGKEMIKISEEIEHIELYLDIQKMRFGDAIETRVNVEEEIMDAMTLKLILQPLVENAIIHGIQEKENKKGMIVINAYLDRDIIIEIIDDGDGINKEDPMLFMSGFGFRNVHERIKLTFGQPYGLTIDLNYQYGTKIVIKVPYITEEVN